MRALESQLTSLESAKKESDQRLSSVGSTLRRIAGIQLDGSVNLPYRLSSPSRRWSPARHHHRACVTDDERSGPEIVDVDPEVVRKGVRSLMQQVAQIERERVTFYQVLILWQVLLCQSYIQFPIIFWLCCWKNSVKEFRYCKLKKCTCSSQKLIKNVIKQK